jgi:STE24 endopeptidase
VSKKILGRGTFTTGLVVLALFLCIGNAMGQESPAPGAAPATVMPSVINVPKEAQPSDHFDVEAATDAYLAAMPAASRARSDAYFEGGYWLILWDFLYGAVIYILLLQFRWSAAMRNFAERITRFKPIQTFIYWTEFTIVTFILGFPIAVYEGYFRERQYGLATQTFGPWFNDQFKMLLVGIVMGGVISMLLFGVVRRLPRTWWIWGSIVSMVCAAFIVLIAPVFLFPIFNKIKPLDDARITAPILRMARANGIPPTRSIKSTPHARPRA